jgi:ribosomal protein S12 methylthiotransferase accessory factor
VIPERHFPSFPGFLAHFFFYGSKDKEKNASREFKKHLIKYLIIISVFPGFIKLNQKYREAGTPICLPLHLSLNISLSQAVTKKLNPTFMEMEITFAGGKKVNASYKGHVHKTDQPVTSGGENSAPSPYELFLASIGTCAGIYVKSFCDQRNLPTENIKLIQSLEFSPEKKVPSKISIEIQVPSDFPEKYREAVVSAAELCAVKRTIADPPVFEIRTVTV